MKGAKSKAKGDTKLGVRKKAESKKGKSAAKDPNKPKRPPSAFFVFMEEFRKTYKEKHPNNKSVAAVGKAGGNKWKEMSDAVSIGDLNHVLNISLQFDSDFLRFCLFTCSRRKQLTKPRPRKGRRSTRRTWMLITKNWLLVMPMMRNLISRSLRYTMMMRRMMEVKRRMTIKQLIGC